MGLLGNSFDDPQSQMVLGLAQGLLSSNGSQGLSAGLGNVQAVQQNIIKNKLLNAQLGEIGVSTQMKDFQLQKLKNWLAISQGISPDGSSSSLPQAAPTGVTQSPMAQAPSGMGAAPIPMMGGNQAAPMAGVQPQATQGAAPTGGKFAFGIPGMSDNQSRMLAAGMNQEDYLKSFLERSAPQLDITKLMVAQGIDPNSPQGQKMLQDATTKANYIAPANIRPGGYTQSANGVVQQFPHIPDGFQGVMGADGRVALTPVQGGLAAMAAASTAQASGGAAVAPTTIYDASGNPAFSNKLLDSQRGAPAASQQGYVTEPAMRGQMAGGMGGSAKAIDNEIAQSQQSLSQVTDPSSIAMLKEHIAQQQALKAQYFPGVGNPQATSAALNGAPGLATPQGSMTPAPLMGAVSNANTAQTASADAMKISFEKLQSANSTSQAAGEAIAKMQGLAANKTSSLTFGSLGTGLTAINADAAEYEKQRANLIALFSSAGATDASRANTAQSVPDFGKPKSAIADGLTTLNNQRTLGQLKSNFLTPIFQAGDSKNYVSTENAFDQNVTPAMAPILTMPANQSRSMLLSSAIAKDPTLRSKFEWAIKNGLLK